MDAKLPSLPRLAAALARVSLGIAVVGVFVLPWYVGGGGMPVPGASYELGFSNKTGIFSLAVAIALATLGKLVSPARPSAISWFDVSPQILPRWQEGRAEYLVLAVACLIWGGVLWAWGRFLVDPSWTEARGFVNGMDLLALGRVPYRDFFYNYGPATLYAPYWLSRMTQGDMSFETAYLIVLVLFATVGFGMLFLLVRMLSLSSREKAVLLGLSFLGWAFICMGLQGTALRVCVVPGVIVLLDALVWRQHGMKPTGLRGLAIIGMGSAAATFACQAVSPEMGIAGSLGICAFGVPLWMAGRRTEAVAIALGCVVLNLVAVMVLPDYFLGVLAFASGGDNYPIYPGVHNLIMVGSSLYVFPGVIAAAFVGPSDRRAPLAMALAVGGGMMLPAALGKCDPTHVFSNGTTLITLMFAAARALDRRAMIAWTATYVFAFIILIQYFYWLLYWNNYVAAWQMRKFYDDNPAVVDEWREKWNQMRRGREQGARMHWSSVLPFPEALDRFTNEGPALLVAGNEWNFFLARYLNLQQNPPPDYFSAYSQGAVTPSQIDRKIRDSLAAKFLLIPVGIFSLTQGDINIADYERGLQANLSRLLLFPVRSRIRNKPYIPDAVIAKRLLEYFEPVAQFENYVVLKKKSNAPATLDAKKPD